MANIFEGIEGPIMGARYLSAVALACLIYDHLTHFDEELTDVWFNLRDRTWLKLMFLCGRYATGAFVIYTAALMGGFNYDLSRHDCQTYIAAGIFLFNVAVIGTEGVVIYRIRCLWDHNRHITYAIAAMFMFVLATMTMATVFEVTKLPKHVITLPRFPECLFLFSDGPIPYMLAEAIVLVVWDIFNVIVFTSNSLANPYQCSADVMKKFKKDGGRYFLCLLGIRSIHLFMMIFGKDSRLSTIPLASSLSVVINARIFHRIGRDFERIEADALGLLGPFQPHSVRLVPLRTRASEGDDCIHAS